MGITRKSLLAPIMAMGAIVGATSNGNYLDSMPKSIQVGDSIGKNIFAGYGHKTSSHRKTVGHRKNKR